MLKKDYKSVNILLLLRQNWLFIGALLIHLSMLVSWRVGFLNPLFFDATVTHGRRGWDFYALYQAGHNVLTGHSVYQSDGAQIDMVIPDGTYTPFRYLPVSAYTVGVLLNLLPPLWAYRAWVAWLELLLLFCVWLTWRNVKDKTWRTVLCAVWLVYTPFYLELYMGQFSFVQATLLWIMLLVARPERTFDAAWIASVLWKQNTALLTPLLVRLNRWKSLAWLAALILISTGPYFALVPGSLTAFLGNLRSDPPWFQFGNLGFRQLVFDSMWSFADTFKLTVGNEVYIWAQRGVVILFVLVPILLTMLDRRLDLTLHISLWITTYLWFAQI